MSNKKKRHGNSKAASNGPKKVRISDRPSDLECALYLGIPLDEYRRRASELRKWEGEGVTLRNTGEFVPFEYDLNRCVKARMEGRL